MKSSPTRPYQTEYDLTNCDAEPLHLIRHFQGHATLLVVDPESLVIKACSANLTEQTGHQLAEIIGQHLQLVFDADTVEIISSSVKADEYLSRNPVQLPLWRNERYPQGANLILHDNGQFLVLELEPRDSNVSSSSFLLRVDQSLQRISNVGGSDRFYETMVTEVRKLSGFDRVMLYQFDEDYNGEVVAEAKLAELTPFLNLRYPHTDIPKQARELYLRTPVRHIVSTDPAMVSEVISTSELKDVDLGLAANRGVSPFHLEYLKNMSVGASMSIAIVLEGKLWGLVACHHHQPKLIDYRLRTIFALMSKIMSSHLALRQSNRFRDRMLQTSLIRSRLFEKMSEDFDILSGLMSAKPGLAKLMEAQGAALLLDGKLSRIGECPGEDLISQLISWLDEKPESLYQTHELEKVLKEQEWFNGEVGGLLAIRLGAGSSEYILWFRPQIVQTVHWGGDPARRKMVEDGTVRLNPELSFAKWKQEIKGLASKWEQHHLDAAVALRNDIKEIILQKYQQVRRANEELTEAYGSLEDYSYTVSHDLKAPLRNIKGFAEVLREDYGDQLDEMGLFALQTIEGSVGKMERLINDILEFSRVGSKKLVKTEIDLPDLLGDIWAEHSHSHDTVSMQLELGQKKIFGDRTQLRQLFANLISNSVKYARVGTESSWVKISSVSENGHCYFEVTDNGIGFDMRYAGDIFNVFNRLVSDDQYEGSGIGLAIVKRIVELHDGDISVKSELGQGTKFEIRLGQ